MEEKEGGMDTLKVRRSREFRTCFSIIDVEMELETMHDKKRVTTATNASSSFKEFKRRIKPGIFKSKAGDKDNEISNLYDVENELLLLEQDQKIKDAISQDAEICIIRREISSDNARFTLWSRESITDPSHRSCLPETENMFLEAALGDNVEIIVGILDRYGTHNDLIECTDELGRTALHLAASCGNTKVIEALLDRGAQIDIWDSHNMATPLMCAASLGSLDALRTLLKRKADVNIGYENGKTALYLACSEGHYKCAEALLEHGAKQSATAIFTETPLHAAARGDSDMLKLLLDNGADVTLLSGTERNTALHLAAQEFELECCKLLVNAGSSARCQNARGLTPLHFAAFGNPRLTEFFLTSGNADPNLLDNERRSPLFYAVGKGEAIDECLDLLLAHNANVNLQDECGYTPLHIASVKEASKSAAILLRYGADLTLKNVARQSALALFSKRMPDAMKIFKEYLNDSVTITSINYKPNVKLDFSPLVPGHLSKPKNRRDRRTHHTRSESEVRVETNLLRCFLETGQEEILLHPLAEAFLFLKWKRLRKFFIASFIMQLVLVLFYSSFILEMYKVRCPYSAAIVHIENNTQITGLNSSTGTMSFPEIGNSTELPDNNKTIAMVIESLTSSSTTDVNRNCRIRNYFSWILVITLGVITLLKEIIQLIQCPEAYLKNLENWALILFLMSISLSLIPPDTLITAKLSHLLRHQYAIAALGVCLAWGLMFIYIGKFPSVGLYVQMFVKVGSNFVTFIMVYGCIMIAFAMAFALVFPKIRTFNSFLEIILKLIRLMNGDVNLEYMIYDNYADSGALLPSPIVANIVHTSAVVVLSVVLMNLLVGLAVNDIQGLFRTAKLNKLARQAELIAYLESFLLSERFLYFLHKSLRKALLKSIIITPSYYKCFLYFNPNDREDKRLPEDLKCEIIRLAKEQGSTESQHLLKGNIEMGNKFKKLEEQIVALQGKIEQLIQK